MPPYPLNPVNDFYMRQSMPYQFGYPQRQSPQVNCHFVTNIEEAKAALIDGFSCNLFLDSSNGKIYLKKINNNGLSEFIVYSANDSKPADPMAEINARLERIEAVIGGKRNEPVSNDGQPNQGVGRTIAEQNGSDDAPKPAGIPANDGNDIWQIRN